MLCFSPEAAARWLAFAQETEAALVPGGAFSPIAAFALHLPEHAARLAAVLALVDESAGADISPDISADISTAALESGIALARYYAAERLRLLDLTAPPLTEAEQEDLLREWLTRTRPGTLLRLRDVCRSAPKQIRRVDIAYKLMRRMERLGLVAPANDAFIPAAKGDPAPRRVRARYLWRVDGDAGEGASLKNIAKDVA